MKKGAAVESTENLGEGVIGRLGIKNLGLIAYFICTVIGFAYATVYYHSFGIDILNHVAPLDLLFISFAHLGKIITTPLIVLLEVIAIATVLLVSYLVAVALAAILTAVVYIYSTPMPLIVRALVEIAASRWSYLAPLSRRTRATIERSDVPTSYQRARELRRRKIDELRASIQSAKTIYIRALGIGLRLFWFASSGSWMGIRHSVEWLLNSYLYRVGARDVMGQGKVWYRGAQQDSVERHHWRFKSWGKMKGVPRGLLLGLVFLLVQAPILTGRVDANAILNDKGCSSGEEVLSCYFEKLKVFHLFPTNSECYPVVYAIPSGNLASLRFAQCGQPGQGRPDESVNITPTGNATVGRKYATPYFRHRAGEDTRHDDPACLVYLGATSSTHFFADLSDDGDEEGSCKHDDQSCVSAGTTTGGTRGGQGCHS